MLFQFDPPKKPKCDCCATCICGRCANCVGWAGRLLAILQAGRQPLAWDPQTQIATASFYAEPPALYERALVMCSGLAPLAALSERETRYRDVTHDAASAIYSRLMRWHDTPS